MRKVQMLESVLRKYYHVDVELQLGRLEVFDQALQMRTVLHSVQVYEHAGVAVVALDAMQALARMVQLHWDVELSAAVGRRALHVQLAPSGVVLVLREPLYGLFAEL